MKKNLNEMAIKIIVLHSVLPYLLYITLIITWVIVKYCSRGPHFDVRNLNQSGSFPLFLKYLEYLLSLKVKSSN